MQLRSIDVTDIRSANGTATGLPLAEEVLESLRPNIETQLVSEEGYATVQWNKKIPTSMTTFANDVISAKRVRYSL